MILDGEDHPLVGRRIRLKRKMTNFGSKWLPEEGDMPEGLEGTITYANLEGPIKWQQIVVAWDNGRRLMLLPEVDSYELLPKKEGAVNVD